jgi:hypothetical protein
MPYTTQPRHVAIFYDQVVRRDFLEAVGSGEARRKEMGDGPIIWSLRAEHPERAQGRPWRINLRHARTLTLLDQFKTARNALFFGLFWRSLIILDYCTPPNLISF